MTLDWLSVLVVPTQVEEPAAQARTVLQAGAQLVLGHLSRFDAQAEAAGHPPIAGLADWQPDDVHGWVLRTLGLLASGQSIDLNALRQLAASDGLPLDARAVLAVLAALGWSDVGQPALGMPDLFAVAGAAKGGPLRAFMSIHMSLRLQEGGDDEQALSLTRSALTDLRPGRTRLARTLDAVARRNESQLAWAVERRIPPNSPRSHSVETLAWMDAVAEEGLIQYLDENFNAFFDDPYTRTISFGTENRIDNSLRRSLFQAELLGDRSSYMQLRKVLGRYRLLTRAGQPGQGAQSAFALLRRAGDHDGLARSLAVFRAGGPLEVLRTIGYDTVGRSWPPPELHAVLTVIASAAITFDATAAGRACDRLVEALPTLLARRVGGAFLAGPAFDCLAGVAPLLDERRLVRLSSELRTIADRPPEPIVHQSMATVLHALPWEHLDREERNRWFHFVSARLGAQDDRLFPARIVAAELLHTDRSRAKRAVIAAFRRSQSLWLAPLLLEARPLPSDVVGRLRVGVVASAERLQADARKGHYGMGGLPIGALLGEIAADDPRRATRDFYLSFVSDPSVPIDERVGALQIPLQRPERFPGWLRARLGAGVPGTAASLSLLGDPADLDLANLRLRARFGRIPASEALSLALTFSASPNTQARASIAQIVDELGTVLPEPQIATIVLSLSRDRVPVVRGYAGQSLATLKFNDAILEAARSTRVAELLREGGEIVPGLTWQGILHATRGGRPLPKDLQRLARVVSEGHIAASVREVAARVLNG